MNIIQSVSALQRIYQITNLTPWLLDRTSWTFKRSRFLEFYTIFMIVLACGVVISSLFIYHDFMKTSGNEIGVTVDFIQLLGIRTAYIVSITEALLRREDQKLFYEQLKEIDKIFERSLNVEVKNRDFRRKIIKRGILTLIVYIIAEGFILSLNLISADKDDFYIYWLCYLLPMLICGLRYFQTFTAIRLLKSRFDHLIKILNKIQFEAKAEVFINPEIFKIKSSQTPLNSITPLGTTSYMEHSFKPKFLQSGLKSKTEMEKLLIIRDLYNRLYSLTELINRYFGLSLLINVGNNFISITSNSYWIFINFKTNTGNVEAFWQIAGSCVWSAPHVLNLLVLAILSEKTMKSTAKMALGLHRIQIDTMNDNQNAVIQQFSLQLLHQKISITAAGFFNIDCSLLYAIVGATTTYLIILIQFYLNVSPN